MHVYLNSPMKVVIEIESNACRINAMMGICKIIRVTFTRFFSPLKVFHDIMIRFPINKDQVFTIYLQSFVMFLHVHINVRLNLRIKVVIKL